MTVFWNAILLEAVKSNQQNDINIWKELTKSFSFRMAINSDGPALAAFASESLMKAKRFSVDGYASILRFKSFIRAYKIGKYV